jgi:creatinine amidohydrolase
LVRADALANGPKASARDGVYGDPKRATAELGRVGVEMIVETSVARIRELARAR